LGDAEQRVIAVDENCQQVWSIELGEQVLGSLAISDNDGEIFASGAKYVYKLSEQGNTVRLVWKVSPEIFRTPGGMLRAGNLNLAGLSSNGLIVHVGVGPAFRGHILPIKVGLAFLDRDSGHILYAAEGREESIAAMTSSPDGGVYLAHSPIRRAVAHAFLPKHTRPLVGGIGQYQPVRLDLLVRDAGCAALYRLENFLSWQSQMLEIAVALDLAQVAGLLEQARGALLEAIERKELDAPLSEGLMERLREAHELIDQHKFTEGRSVLEYACALFAS
jgi:hypothetical protein